MEEGSGLIVTAIVIIAATAIGILILALKRLKRVKETEKKNILTILFNIFICLLFIGSLIYSFPVLIRYLVYSPNLKILSEIPGNADDWFPFWASYSSVVATVIISIFTYLNTRNISEQEERFLKLFTENNLRISKFTICQFKQKTTEKGKCSYGICLKFVNVSYSMIKDIRIKKFYIKIGDKNEKGKNRLEKYVEVVGGMSSSRFRLQGNTPSIVFDLTLQKGTVEEKRFTEFYYYDYFMNSDKLDIRMEMELSLHEDGKKNRGVGIDITLQMTSQNENEWKELLYFMETPFYRPIKKVLIDSYLIEEV